jgi:hypothetical protein
VVKALALADNTQAASNMWAQRNPAPPGDIILLKNPPIGIATIPVHAEVRESYSVFWRRPGDPLSFI